MKFLGKKQKILGLTAISGLVLVLGLAVIENVSGNSIKVKKEIPEYYTETLTVRLGEKSLSVAPLGGRLVKANKQDMDYIYQNAYVNTDVIQSNYPYQVKEQLVFHQPGHPISFEYRLGNIDGYIVKKDDKGNICFYDEYSYEKDRELAKIFTIPAPFVEDALGNRSYGAVQTIISQNSLVITVEKEWLEKAVYPVVLDPTVEINVLNVESHPQQGDKWQVNFTTFGKADLKIIPEDEATVKDDEFLWLKCDGEIKQPEILDGDVIYYKNWKCDGIGEVVHQTLTAGKHALRFEFGGVMTWAHNDPADEWWDGDWGYRLPIAVDNSGNTDSLTDYQIYVELDSSDEDFWNNVDSAGDDIRFTAADGETEFDFWTQYFDYSGQIAGIWLQIDTVPAGNSTTTYLYYGNAGADSNSSSTAPFLYDTVQDLYYIVRQDAGSYPVEIVSLVDNNTVQVDSQTAVDLNRQEMTSFSSLSADSVIKAKGPIAMKINNANQDAAVPISFASTAFVSPSTRNTDYFHIYSPFATSDVTIYDGTSQEQNNEVATGTAWGISNDIGTVGLVEATKPVLFSFDNSGPYDGYVVYPNTTDDLYGIRSGSNYIGIASNSTEFDIYCSSGSSANVTGRSRGTNYTNSTCGSTSESAGTTNGVRLTNINNPLGAIQQADSDGGESTTFLPKKEFGTEYMVPTNAAYIVVVCPAGSGTVNLSIYSESNSFVTSGTCIASATDPGKAYFGSADSTTYNAGSRIVSTDSPAKPFYAYYEDTEASGASGGDETNMWSWPQARKYSYPHPSYALGSQESRTGANPPSLSSVDSAPATVVTGADVTFAIDWSDGDGDNIKAKVCKTDNLTNQNCDDGYWATSTSFTAVDPLEINYTTTEDDIGGQDYYVFVCDVTGRCSASSSGSFTVQADYDEGWWDSDWSKRIKIIFDTTDSATTTDLVNFPALVKVNSDRVDYGEIQNQGEDVRFLDSDNSNELDYEIELWDETGDSYLWVEVPNIAQNSSTDFIWMYYGNDGASNNATTTGVWDDNFLLVHHLDDVYDSTKYYHYGDNESASTSTSGVVDGAFSFNGVDAKIKGDPGVHTIADSLSMTAWFNSTGGGTDYPRIVEFSNSSGDSNSTCIAYDPDGSMRAWAECENGTRAGEVDYSSELYTDGDWHYAVYIYENQIGKLYIDGEFKASASDDGCDDIDDMETWVIGNYYPSTNYGFSGLIDEVRVSDVARTDDWFEFEYCNMIDSCNSYGAEDIVDASEDSSYISIQRIFTNRTVLPGNSVNFRASWHDSNYGSGLKLKICKTNLLTSQICDGGQWASSTDFSLVNPVTAFYTALESDVGSHLFYAFICNSSGECSSSRSGIFSVRHGDENTQGVILQDMEWNVSGGVFNIR